MPQLSCTYVRHRESFSFLIVTTFFVKALSCSVNLCARKILRPGSFPGTHPAAVWCLL